MGSFKHKIDEGAEIRNSAFALLDSTLNFKYVGKFEQEIIEEILNHLGFKTFSKKFFFKTLLTFFSILKNLSHL